MGRFRLGIYWVLLFGFVWAGGAAAENRIHFANGKLSLNVSEAPFQDVVAQLARHGLRVKINSNFNPRVSASFTDLDLQKGLAVLLKNYNYLLIWKRDPTQPETQAFLSEIRIFDQVAPVPGKLSPNLAVIEDAHRNLRYVKDTLLMRLKPGVSKNDFESWLETLGARIVEHFSALGVYEIRLPPGSDIPALIARLEKNDLLKTAEPDYVYEAPKLIKYRSDREMPARASKPIGEGDAPIAVLDTGVVMVEGLQDKILASIDIVNPAAPISDTVGHGTRMSMIAAGVAQPLNTQPGNEPANPIIPIKIVDDHQMTSNTQIMRSVDFALDQQARVMSLSWHTEQPSDFLEDTLDYAASNGVIVVAAAGNEPTGEPVYPAAYPSVIGVGATAPDGSAWDRSNFGDFVVLAAPGFAAMPTGENKTAEIYAGTSIATAYVANRIAAYLSKHPTAGRPEALEAVKKELDRQSKKN